MVEGLSTTINSHGRRVKRMSAATHCRVDSSGLELGMMIDARPESEWLGFKVAPNHGDLRGFSSSTASAPGIADFGEYF